jgi:hypothetical protein
MWILAFVIGNKAVKTVIIDGQTGIVAMSRDLRGRPANR